MFHNTPPPRTKALLLLTFCWSVSIELSGTRLDAVRELVTDDGLRSRRRSRAAPRFCSKSVTADDPSAWPP